MIPTSKETFRRLRLMPISCVAAALLFSGCGREIVFNPPDSQTIRHVVRDQRRAEFGQSVVVVLETWIYDRQTNAYDGRPAKNRISVRRTEFEATPWDHPIISGRPGTLAAMQGQEFRVETNRNFESSVTHLGGEKRQTDVMTRLWQWTDEAILLPAMLDVGLIAEGDEWSGTVENGNAKLNYTLKATGMRELQEGGTVWAIEGQFEGRQRLSPQTVSRIDFKVDAEYDAKRCYFPKSVYTITARAPQFTEVRTITRQAVAYADDLETPFIEASGLSAYSKKSAQPGLVIDGAELENSDVLEESISIENE